MIPPVVGSGLHRLLAGPGGTAVGPDAGAPTRRAVGAGAGVGRGGQAAAGRSDDGHAVPGRPDDGHVVAGRPEVGSTEAAAGEECRLCAAPVPAEHRHVLDLEARTLCCACRACAVLFSDPAAGGRRYRLVPDRRWHLRGFDLDDETWASLGIPVETAFVFEDSAAERPLLCYPSPGGAVEAPLDPKTWQRLRVANPVLRGLAPDVEALLVNRIGAARDHWLVPVDDCYALVGLLRTHWKGLAGGPEVWAEIRDFFAGLQRRARVVTADLGDTAGGADAARAMTRTGGATPVPTDRSQGGQ
jgi:hypothetical protein